MVIKNKRILEIKSDKSDSNDAYSPVQNKRIPNQPLATIINKEGLIVTQTHTLVRWTQMLSLAEITLPPSHSSQWQAHIINIINALPLKVCFISD